MSSRTYENVQGVLSFVALFSFVVASVFTLEYHQLLNAMDLSDWGRTYLPPVFTTAWIIFGLTMVAKVWGDLANVGFYRRIQISNKLYNLADRIDPRRK